MLAYNGNLKQVARTLRANMTDAERHLWAKVRFKQLKGCQFYRQKPIGDYIVDFFCPRAKLVIEVDGPYHRRRVQADAWRERALWRLGYTVLRLEEEVVVERLPEALARIRAGLCVR